MKESFIAAIIVLSAAPVLVYSKTVELVPVSSGTSSDSNGDGTFDTFAASTTLSLLDLNWESVTTLSFRQRPVYEFDFSSIPLGAIIDSAILDLDAGLRTLIAVADEKILVHGFEGNGIAEPADATELYLLGTREFDLWSPLDVSKFVASNVGRRFLGFSLHKNKPGNTSTFHTPRLRVVYQLVPEPDSFRLVFATAIAGLLYGSARFRHQD